MKISAPVPINDTDDFVNFDCDEDSLSHWLKNRALKKQKSGASSTFVIKSGNEIVGFYCLSAGAISRDEAPKNLSRNSPNPLPIILLGRLAIDNSFKGFGLGADLMKDVLLRTIAIAQEIGVMALITHALNENAKNFYLQYGFIESSIAPMTLILPIKNLL